MAPNHFEEPEPRPERHPAVESGTPVDAFGGSDDPPADTGSLSIVDDQVDTGSLSLAVLTQASSDESAQPIPIDEADLPPARTSELAVRWTVRQQVGGVPFVASDPSSAARDLAEAAVARTGGEHVHLANAYSVALANEFPALAAETFCADGWNLPDGRPISWISQLRRDRPALRQVRGPQFMLDVCEEGVGLGLRHFLLGGAPEVLDRLEAALRERFPGIEIVGTCSPPFREPLPEELAERDAAIVTSGAQLVWVGLGTPKQDREAVRLAESTGLVAVAIGAAFDFAAGTLREAPGWMRAMGLEWLFRLLMEPRRLWRRYLIGNVRFLIAALRPRSGV